jgi:hypothetical protein
MRRPQSTFNFSFAKPKEAPQPVRILTQQEFDQRLSELTVKTAELIASQREGFMEAAQALIDAERQNLLDERRLLESADRRIKTASEILENNVLPKVMSVDLLEHRALRDQVKRLQEDYIEIQERHDRLASGLDITLFAPASKYFNSMIGEFRETARRTLSRLEKQRDAITDKKGTMSPHSVHMVVTDNMQILEGQLEYMDNLEYLVGDIADLERQKAGDEVPR